VDKQAMIFITINFMRLAEGSEDLDISGYLIL